MRAIPICSIVLMVFAVTASAAVFRAPETVAVAAGPFVAGSDRAERDRAYGLDEAANGQSVTCRDR